MKLTEAQREALLRAKNEHDRFPCAAITRRALWSRRLIEPSTSTDGPMTRWRITDLGRAALAQQGSKP